MLVLVRDVKTTTAVAMIPVCRLVLLLVLAVVTVSVEAVETTEKNEKEGGVSAYFGCEIARMNLGRQI